MNVKPPLKKLKIVLIFFISIGSTSPLFSQIKKDSLKNIWTSNNIPDSLRFKAIKSYYYNNTYAKPDTVISLTKYHYQLGKEKGVVKEMASALNERSYAHYIKGDLNTSIEVLKQSISLLEKINEPKNLIVIQSNLGSIYNEQKEYLKAFNSFTTSLEIIRDFKLKTSEARILAKIGDIYNTLDELDLAMEYFDKSLTICVASKISKQNQIGTIFLKKAEIYYKKQQYSQAIDYSNKAIIEFNDTNNKNALSNCYMLLAKANKKLFEKDLAITYTDKALAINYELDNNSKIIETQILKSYLLLDTKPAQARNLSEKSLQLLKPETSNKIKADLHKLLYECYKRSNQTNRALSMIEKYTVFKDSFQLEKNKILIIKETIKRQYEQKLKETEAINEKENAIVKLTYTYRIYFVLSLSILLIFLFAYIFRMKNKKTRDELDSLLAEINTLKRKEKLNLLVDASNFELNKEKIQASINRKLNKTDWSVLNVLLQNPEASNKEISEKVFLSIDGIGSSLRRMYQFFDLKETKYKKVLLIKRAIEISKDS
ncbi:tetratricopeptide repeat protein [Flavobacteriaceae bacterium]|nr:tetratricopeptide repeat protein [Flavobacteriaceae bacterium]